MPCFENNVITSLGWDCCTLVKKKGVICFTLFEFLPVCLSLLTAREESQSDLQDRASAQGHRTEEDNVQQGEGL